MELFCMCFCNQPGDVWTCCQNDGKCRERQGITPTKVHRKMTSWRRKQPRINIDTRLREEHSGSFNVLIHWLRGLCDRCAWITGRLHRDIRAWRQLSKTRNQCCELMGKCPLCRNVWVSCFNNFEFLHLWLHCAWKYTRIVRTKPCCGNNLGGNPEEPNRESGDQIFVALTTLCGKTLYVARVMKVCF